MYTITMKLVTKVFLTRFKGFYALLHKCIRKSGENHIHYFHGYCVHCVYCCIDSSQINGKNEKNSEENRQRWQVASPGTSQATRHKMGMAAEMFAQRFRLPHHPRRPGEDYQG